MSITTLPIHAPEKGTYVVTAAFTDETGAAVVPNAGLTWTLTDMQGVVVNSRSAVSIASASSINIVLTGSDLELSDTYLGNLRAVVIQGTYNSSLGSNLPIKKEVRFVIDDFVAVS